MEDESEPCAANYHRFVAPGNRQLDRLSSSDQKVFTGFAVLTEIKALELDGDYAFGASSLTWKGRLRLSDPSLCRAGVLWDPADPAPLEERPFRLDEDFLELTVFGWHWRDFPDLRVGDILHLVSIDWTQKTGPMLSRPRLYLRFDKAVLQIFRRPKAAVDEMPPAYKLVKELNPTEVDLTLSKRESEQVSALAHWWDADKQRAALRRWFETCWRTAHSAKSRSVKWAAVEAAEPLSWLRDLALGWQRNVLLRLLQVLPSELSGQVRLATSEDDAEWMVLRCWDGTHCSPGFPPHRFRPLTESHEYLGGYVVDIVSRSVPRSDLTDFPENSSPMTILLGSVNFRRCALTSEKKVVPILVHSGAFMAFKGSIQDDNSIIDSTILTNFTKKLNEQDRFLRDI